MTGKFGGFYHSLFCFVTFRFHEKFLYYRYTIYYYKGKGVWEIRPVLPCNRVSKYFCANYSTNGISLVKQILLMYSDGGGHHNVNYNFTKIYLISLFLQLDLDMLVELICFLTQSWVNPSEKSNVSVKCSFTELCTGENQDDRYVWG